MHRATTIVAWSLAAACWSGFAIYGLVRLFDYSARPTHMDHPPEHWPADSRIPRAENAGEMVMFVHPQCPCTRASLAELARLIPRLTRPMSITIAFVIPDGRSPDFAHGAIWDNAGDIRDVHRYVDIKGEEARRFNATTSGQVLVYDHSGGLRYFGGITAGRGHEGDNAGVEALLDRFDKTDDFHTFCNVYGCPLFDTPDRAPEGGK